ncbi:MAG: hypothetical protein ABR521_08540 [Gaiellaceae bacterium]
MAPVAVVAAGLALLGTVWATAVGERQEVGRFAGSKRTPACPVAAAPSRAFERPIPPGAAIDPRSKQLVRSVVEAASDKGFVVALRSFTVAVYVASRATPRRDVRLTAPWAPRPVLRSVPIPSGARPDPESDGHLAIVDRRTGCEYDFWQARRTRTGTWVASWGNRIPIGRRVFPDGLSARASGFSLTAGLITPDELRRGRIDHALVFHYPFTRAGGFVPPATQSDGRSHRRDAIPEGARLQLDPSLDLDKLDLEPYERTIARALQRYGMLLGDTGGAVSLFAAHPHSYEGDAYDGLLPDEDFAALDGILLERLRVLRLPRLRN